MIIWDFSWERPSVLYWLILTPLFPLFAWILERWRKKILQFLYEKEELADSFRSPAIFWTRTSCMTSVWILGLLAFAGPQGNPSYPPERVRWRAPLPVDFLFVLDVSQSMQVADTRSGASRLAYATEIIRDLIPSLSGQRVSLWLLTDQTISLVPATTDLFYFLFMLEEARKTLLEGMGTNFSSFVRSTVEWSGTVDKGVVLLFSDGEDPMIESLPLQERRQAVQALREALQNIGTPVYTIGVGSEEGGRVPGVLYEGREVHSSLQKYLLEAISQQTLGQYLPSQEEPIAGLVSRLDSILARKKSLSAVLESPGTQLAEYTPFYLFPLAGALLLSLILVCLPYGFRPAKGEGV